MKMNDSPCLNIKRRGAEYVARLPLNKSREEQFDFWVKHTEMLLSKQKLKKGESISHGGTDSLTASETDIKHPAKYHDD